MVAETFWATATISATHRDGGEVKVFVYVDGGLSMEVQLHSGRVLEKFEAFRSFKTP